MDATVCGGQTASGERAAGWGRSVFGPVIIGGNGRKPGGGVARAARVNGQGQMVVADLGHPAGTSQVAFHGPEGPVRLFGGSMRRMSRAISSLLTPSLSASFIGVEKTKVSFVVLVVVFGDAIGPRHLVGYLGMGICLGHQYPLPLGWNREAAGPRKMERRTIADCCPPRPCR